MTRVTTGYYGRIDNGRIRTTKVHKLGLNGKPLCGSKVGPKMQFHYCSHSGSYVTCEHCKAKTIG